MPWEETDNEIRHRVEDPDKFEADSFKRKEITDGVSIVIGKLKGQESMTVQAYRFDKAKFTLAQAKEWWDKNAQKGAGHSVEFLDAVLELAKEYIKPGQWAEFHKRARGIAGGRSHARGGGTRIQRAARAEEAARAAHFLYADVPPQKVEKLCEVEGAAKDISYHVFKTEDALGERFYVTDGVNTLRVASAYNNGTLVTINAAELGKLAQKSDSVEFEAALTAAVKAIDWDAAFEAQLPDDAFAFVSKDGKRRMFAHHDATSGIYGGLSSSIDAIRLNRCLKEVAALISAEKEEDKKRELATMKKHLEEHLRDISVDSASIKARFTMKGLGEEKRVVTGIVLEPDVVQRMGADGFTDVIGAEEIEKAAWDFMSNVRKITVDHNAPAPKTEVVESYIAPADFSIGNEKVLKGSWVLSVRILDDALWAAIKEGKYAAFSVGGSAEREPASAVEFLPQAV